MHCEDEGVKRNYVITKELDDKLEEFVQRTGKKKKFVINAALEQYFARHDNQKNS